jgi:trimeric autotransporter adhesin
LRPLLVISSGLLLILSFGCGGSSTPPATTPTSPAPPTTPTAPAPPSVTSVTPSKIPAGSGPTSITVAGSGFVSSSIVQVGAVSEQTVFDSSTELKATVPASQSTVGAELPVVVTNGTVSSSNTPALNLEVDNPSPAITAINPDSVVAGAGATTVTITGSGFMSASAAQLNGSGRTASYVSATQLKVMLTAADLSAAGNAAITVVNPAPGGGSSAPGTLTITAPVVASAPVPALTFIAPAGAPIGTSTQITLTGSGFTADSVAQWNGTALPTTFTSTTAVTAQVPASLLNLPGNYQVTVTNPAPGGGTSSALPFTGFVGLPTNAMTYNPSNGLFYVSVPSAAGPPYGNCVVSVDPATGALGAPIFVGSEPDKLAIAGDGQTMWVGLDAASTIEEVNLATGAVGMQIPLGDDTGIYDFPPVLHSISVLPGTSTSIAVSITTNNGLYVDYIAIFDNGVQRPNVGTIFLTGSVDAIFVNPTLPEIYATALGTGYGVFSYDASGVTLTAGNVSEPGESASSGTELQIDNGHAYLDSAQVLDAEKTTLLGTFYTSGTNPATGPMFSESSTGQYFALITPPGNPTVPYGNQIQVFNESTFNPVSSMTIPVGGVGTGFKYGAGNDTETTVNGYNFPDSLMRWGSNGLAFRAPNGVFSFRSNLITDLSAVDADLGVSLAASNSATTGANATFTATVTDNGPSAATGVVFSAGLTGNAQFVSATASQGSCTQAPPIECSLGSLANGAKATVSVVVLPMASGALVASAQVNGSETDPVAANNSATASIAVTGGAVNPQPAITSLSPNAVQTGSPELTVTIAGSGFTEDSTVLWSGTPLATAYLSATQLTAQVPASALKSLGWAGVSVTTPAPGGGTTSPVPFSIYNIVSLSANHILFDPYTQQLYASVIPGATQVTGNSLVTIDPTTGVIGTPIPVASQPDKMALSDDGQILYVNQDGSDSVGRFNMLSKTLEFSFPATAGASLRDVAVLPGSENTVAVDLGEDFGLLLYDIDPLQQTGTARGNPTGPYTGSSLQFLNASTLLAFDIDTTGATFDEYPVTSTGLTGSYTNQYTLNSFSAFRLSGGIAFADAGGVANPSSTPPQSMGVFLPIIPTTSPYSYYDTYEQLVAPDTSLSRVFFAAYPPVSSTPSNSQPPVGLVAYDEVSYLPSAVVSLTTLSTALPPGGSGASASLTDLLRWGQDGLALLTSAGQIAILRGPFVLPQLLNQNPAATLSGASPSAIAHGSGNMVLTITGTGFIPGAAVNWNGAYRTTTFVDAGHLTVAIPASDLATAGSATITVANPGAVASAPLTFAIN